MFRYTVGLVLTVILLGCVQSPELLNQIQQIQSAPTRNIISTEEIKFDETKYIRVKNIFCSDGIIYSLYQDTKQSKNGIVVLNAGIGDIRTIENIGNNQSLFIKIDGKVSSYNSNDLFTENDQIKFPDGSNLYFSHKTYIVPEKVIREVAASNEFLTKINLLNNTFKEGNCSAANLEDFKKAGVTNVTQEQVESLKKNAAITGFQKFVELMDSTNW